jgi:hypothetical protein
MTICNYHNTSIIHRILLRCLIRATIQNVLSGVSDDFYIIYKFCKCESQEQSDSRLTFLAHVIAQRLCHSLFITFNICFFYILFVDRKRVVSICCSPLLRQNKTARNRLNVTVLILVDFFTWAQSSSFFSFRWKSIFYVMQKVNIMLIQ